MGTIAQCAKIKTNQILAFLRLRPWMFIVALFLFHAQARANISVCNALLLTLGPKYAELRWGPEAGELYNEIVPNVYLHPSKQTRKALFNLLKRHKVEKSVLGYFLSQVPDALSFWIGAFSKLDISTRNRLLSDANSFFFWKDSQLVQNKEFFENLTANSIVKVDKIWISKYIHTLAINIQKDLFEKGIKTSLIVGPHSILGYGPYLVVEEINRPLKSTFEPDLKIFDSTAIQFFLNLAREEKGRLVIDPQLMTPMPTRSAYFMMRSDIIPSANWIIAMPYEITASVFIHEWQHFIDSASNNEDYEKELISKKVKAHGAHPILTSLWETGEHLERSHLMELRSISKQFFFYKWSGQYPNRFSIDLKYKSENQFKVGIGRILMQPREMEHYKLLWHSLINRILSWGFFDARNLADRY